MSGRRKKGRTGKTCAQCGITLHGKKPHTCLPKKQRGKKGKKKSKGKGN